MTLQRLCHRVRQFRYALVLRVNAEDMQAAQNLLSPSLYKLFKQMPAVEQAHALQVYRQLAAQGHTEPHLLTAALLHDVGKSRFPLRLWERVWAVLVQAFAPRLAADWQLGEPAGLKRALVVAYCHPGWGAQMAKEQGADQQVVEIIRRHQEKQAQVSMDETGRLLAALQAVDDQL